MPGMPPGRVEPNPAQSPEELGQGQPVGERVGYPGLNPSVRQSGAGPAYHTALVDER
jgi:hypothetical protein